MVYFPSPRAICTDVLLRATARIRCNQFLPRKNERIACRLPALLPVTYANYVSTESHVVCYNTALLLLYDSVSVLHDVYPYVMYISHFYSACSHAWFIRFSAIIHGGKSRSEISRGFSRMLAFTSDVHLFRLRLDKPRVLNIPKSLSEIFHEWWLR